MRNIKLNLEYDGSRYRGWQKQSDSSDTVQGRLETLLGRMTGEEVQLIGCGRTDAGVHAIDYTANFHTDTDMSLRDIESYMDRYLPEDIKLKAVKDSSQRFHARYNILSKTYLYKIDNSPHGSVFSRRYVQHIKERLDVQKMRECAEVLTGVHDFQSFTTLKSKTKSTVRTINYLTIISEDEMIDIEINGNGFLWNMVRIIIGTLIEAGKGNLSREDVEHILNEKKRAFAGPLSPAKALYLKSVEY